MYDLLETEFSEKEVGRKKVSPKVEISIDIYYYLAIEIQTRCMAIYTTHLQLLKSVESFV